MFSRALSNHFGILAVTTAGFGGLFADAFAGQYGFWMTLFISLSILLYSFYKEKNISQLYKNEVIPIPIVISIDDNTPPELLFKELVRSIAHNDKRFENLDIKLQEYFNISLQMLTYKYDGDMYNRARLCSFLQIIRYTLNDIQKRLENKVQFHILFLRRPAIAIAVGGMFRTDGIIIYQNSDHNNKLNRVAKIDSRKYKENVDSFKHFNITSILNDMSDKKLLIAIQISSHKISVEHKAFKNFKNIIKLDSIYNGTLPPDEESFEKDFWVENAQEIYNIINKYKNNYNSITLLHSMPEAIGIILGMALENYWNIDVCQYDTGEYKTVVNLNQIKYYF